VTALDKEKELRGLLSNLGELAVAFSGGVDSTYLLKIVSEEIGDKAVAVTAVSPTYPQRERIRAERIASQIGIRHHLIELDETQIDDFSENPPNRCYYCKKELFGKELVSADDFERVSSELQAQKAAYDLARLDLEYTNIRAPIAGYVSERLVRAGNLVKLHDPVYRVTSYDPLLAVLHVPERELSVLRKGLGVSMSLDAWPGQTFTGEVIRISPVVDPGTGTFRVTAKVVDHDRMLKPGLFGRVEILYDLHQDVPVIPRSAVITEDDSSHVFVVDGQGEASRRPVQLGYERAGMVEVVNGVANGETVVTAGKGSLSDGVRVEAIEISRFPKA